MCIFLRKAFENVDMSIAKNWTTLRRMSCLFRNVGSRNGWSIQPWEMDTCIFGEGWTGKHLMNLVTLCLYHFPAQKTIQRPTTMSRKVKLLPVVFKSFRLLLHSPFPVYLLLSPLGTHCPASLVHFSDNLLTSLFFLSIPFFSRMPFWLFLLC